MPIVGRAFLPALCLSVALAGVSLQVSPAAGAALRPRASTTPMAVVGDTGEDITRPDAVSAMVTAGATGERVEDVSQRDGVSRVFANPDGTWTSETASEPERVRDVHGDWRDIDTTLVPRDGGFEPRYSASDLSLSGGGDRVLARLSERGHDLAWKWTGVLPEPVVDGSTATYRGVAPGDGDLVVTATGTGFSYDVVLNERPSGPVELATPVVTDGAQLSETPQGGVEIASGSGAVLAAAPQPLMWDAAVDQQGDPVNVAPVPTEVTQTTAGARMTLTPDEGFLANPDTSYPVVVDPTFTTYTTGDMWIQNVDRTTAQTGSDELRVGSADGGATRARTYLDFKDHTWDGKHVTSATLRFWNYYSASCASGAVRASMITGNWSAAGLSWGNQPSVSGSLYDDYAPAHGGPSCDPNDADFNVTAIVDAWAHGTTNNGIRVKAVDETSSNTWRKYRSVNYDVHPAWRPKLIVTYNNYPNTAEQPVVSPGNPGYVTTATPTVKATLTDPDGGELRAKVTIYDAAGTAKWTGYSCSSIANAVCTSNGGTASVQVPASAGLTNGASYTVKAWAEDGSGDLSKAPSTATAFTVDTTKPTITTGDVTATGFSNGQWRNDVPAANTFTFNGPSDTKSFAYTLDGVAQPVKSADGNGDATVAWLPKGGAHTVTVTATDQAGNSADPVTFSFGVGPASFATPSVAARSTGVFPISVSGPPNATGATLSWRYVGQTAWNPAEGVTKAGAAWAGGVANTSDGTASSSGPLLWDAAAQEDPGSTTTPKVTITAPALLELRTCFTYTGTPSQVCSPSRPVQLVPSAFGGNFPTTTVGPAEVALFTGEMSLTEPDAVDTSAGVGRTFASFDPATTSAGAFGPGWSTSLLAPGDADAELVDHRAEDRTFVLVTAGGSSQMFTATDPNAEILQPTGSVEFRPTGTDDGSRLVLNGTTVILTRPQTSTTTWNRDGEAWVLTEAGAGDDPATMSETSFEFTDPGYPSWIAQTEPGAAATCTEAVQDPGCRGLKLTYAGTGQDRRVTKIERITAGAAPATLASYTYTTGGLLETACGPDPDGDQAQQPLCASYDYDTATVPGRTLLKQLTPPGQKPWQFGYDDTGRLATVTRALDLTTTGTGPATWTIRYDLAPTAAGLPDLTAGAAREWGQTTVPSTAFAVFDPSDENTTDLTYADLWYTNADGTTTNSAVHANVSPDGSGTGQWLVDTRWYDDYGNVIRTLDGAGRARALDADPADRAAAAYAASAITVFNDDGDEDHTDNDGTRVEDEYGPVHTATLTDGTTGPYRTHTSYVYDDEAPTLGGGSKPALPDGQTGFNLVVETRHSATGPDMVGEHNTTLVRNDYDPVVAGDGNGWEFGAPTRTKVQLDDGSWSITVTRYDKEARDVETRQPGGNTNADGSGADAHATLTSYYAEDAADIDCRTNADGHPERSGWIGLTCKTGPAGQPSAPTMPITYQAAYNDDRQPTRVLETSGTTTRTTTTNYDTLGRPVTTTVTDGADTRTTTTDYDPVTGLPTRRTGDGGSVSTEYDTWGRPWRYIDVAGMASTINYTRDSQVATRNDGTGTYSYTYDTAAGEHRRLPGTVDVGLPAGTPDTFTLTYDAAGAQSQVAYPNGMRAAYGYDEAGVPTSLDYTDGTGQPLLSFTNTVDVEGRVVTASSDASQQEYTYDALSRLTRVRDKQAGACTTRTYGYSAASERTAFNSYNPDAGGNCQTTSVSVSKTNTYDTANRIRNLGYIYDDLGRTLTVPAADTAQGATGPLNLSYYANDMVKQLTQNFDNGQGGTLTKATSYRLDPTGRISAVTNTTDGSEIKRLRYRFSDPTDAPSSIQSSTDTGSTWTTTRYITIPALGMVGSVENGTVAYLIANLHGDTVASQANQTNALTIDSYTETDEYGNTVDTASRQYGWLGTHQRSTDTIGGMMLMGARLYNPAVGLFLSPDPLRGGNATAFAYPLDPINDEDVTGMSAGGFHGPMYRACREYADWLPCNGAMIRLRDIQILTDRMTGLTDNEKNAGRHFAMIVYLCHKVGCVAAKAMAEAHELESTDPYDSRRDQKNNAYALVWYRRHAAFAEDRFGIFISDGDLQWFIRHGVKLLHEGYLYGRKGNRPFRGYWW